MGSPRTALNVLMEKEAAARDKLVTKLLAMNEERKKIGEEAWTIAEPQAGAALETYHHKLALVYNASIPRGVTGIIAGRLASCYNVPALVATTVESVIVASLRSVRGYDLHLLLEPLEDLFLDWGGHPCAAGFSITSENWQPLLDRLKSASSDIELESEEEADRLVIDAELPLSYLTQNIFTLIDRFEPYGAANSQLLFLAKNLHIVDINLLGKPEAKHVKLTLESGAYKWPAMYWQAVDKVKRDFDLGDTVDVVFTINRNWFKGNETPQMIVSDLRRSG
jgi:single-stranded-DNA-specific exonuclease